MRKLIDWNFIKISQSELDALFPLSIVDQFSLELCRVLILRKRKYLQALLSTEVAILFLLIVFLFPLKVIVFRNSLNISNNIYGFSVICLLSIVTSLSLLLLINYCLWDKAKKLKKIAYLLDKIEEFNSLIGTFQTITNLSLLDDRKSQDIHLLPIELSGYDVKNDIPKSYLDIKEILLITRKYLIQNIKFYNGMYCEINNKIDMYQSLANLENQLVNFVSLPHENNSKECQQILEEIISIGLTVHYDINSHE